MLEQLLKKYYGNGEDPELQNELAERDNRISAEVLSLIEKEKPVKHIRIKPLIIAAAVTALGAVTAVLSVSASIEPSTSDLYRRKMPVYWNENTKEQLQKCGVGMDMKAEEEHYRRIDTICEYYAGKTEEAQKAGKVEVEKALDNTDISGYVEPCRVISLYGKLRDEDAEKQLELIKQFEEDPEAFGLIPAGKTETFKGGLRIVNRQFKNTNEYSRTGKNYYSFRRVYTDDAENKLIASIYLGLHEYFLSPEEFKAAQKSGFHPYDPEKTKTQFFNIILDHTEEGCMYGFDSETDKEWFYPSGSGFQGHILDFDENGVNAYLYYSDYDLKSLTGDEPVTAGTVISVTRDGSQWLD